MNMKKMLSLALAGVMALSLMACSAQNGGDSSENTSSPSSSQSSEETQNNETPESVTITSLNANKEAAELEVPYDPQRIAILDMASLDILDTLGVGDRVVGTASTSLEYLQDYINDDIANLGTIKEADLEAVMACEPDVIFIGGRLASSYDALSEIAPVVYLATDTGDGNRCLQERQHRLSGSPRRVVHRRGRHHRAGSHAAGFGERAAGLTLFQIEYYGLSPKNSYIVFIELDC